MSVLERVGDVLKKYDETDAAFVMLLGRVKTALETSRMVRVSADEIRPYPGQPRKYFDPEALQRLSNAIAGGGQIQAGMIRLIKGSGPVRYEIVDGERRWRAILLIPLDQRPLYKAELIEADSEVVQFLIAGMANFNRQGHEPLETADTIDRYRQFNIPMAAVADLLGIGIGWAYNIHGLRRLPEEVKAMLAPGLKKEERLPIAAAVHLSKFDNPKKQIELAHKILSGDITVSRLRGEIIKMAQESGTQVAVREIHPAKRWIERGHKIRGLDRLVSNLELMLTQPGIELILKEQPGEASAFLEEIRTIRLKLASCEGLLEPYVQKLIAKADAK